MARIPAVSVSRVALSTSKRVVGGTNAYPVSDKLEAITGDSSSTYADAFAKVQKESAVAIVVYVVKIRYRNM